MRVRGLRWVAVVAAAGAAIAVSGAAPAAHAAAAASQQRPTTSKGSPGAAGQRGAGKAETSLPVRAVRPVPAGDEIVAGRGDSAGWHVYAASSGAGWAWQPLATLAPAGLNPAGERWIGRQCITGDGRYVVAVVAPWGADNTPAGNDAGGVAYVIDAHTGAVRPLVSGVSLYYFTPSCGPGSMVALSRYLGTDERTTQLVLADAAGARVEAVRTLRGQYTSAVPAGGGGFFAVSGNAVVRLAPGRRAVAAHAPGRPFDLVANAAGGADYLVGTGRATAAVWHLDSAGAHRAGGGVFSRLALFQGRHGHTVAAGSTGLDPRAGIVALAGQDTPVQAASLAGTAYSPVPVGSPRTAVAPGMTAGTLPGTPLLLVTGHRHVTSWTPAAAAPASTVDPPVLRADGTVARLSGAPAPTSPGGPGARGSRAARGQFTSTCAVARNDVYLQAMQPSPDDVDWAANLAGRSLLTGAAARPAGYANLGLPAYSPSLDFPLPAPFGPGGQSIPREVLEGIFAQESNFSQASWHSVQGVAGNPLIADYYGAGGGYVVGAVTPDCGYGLGQVTTGMQTGAMAYDLQRKVAVDYAENAAAAAQILAQKWNELAAAGITANGSDPSILENWYLALWDYNSGLHSNTGSGPWGLGWANNPANPDYPYNRGAFLHVDIPGGFEITYGDAATPANWPYQEKVFGWMEVPIRSALTGDASYAGTIQTFDPASNTNVFEPDPFELTRPGIYDFCDTSDNQCDPTLCNRTLYGGNCDPGTQDGNGPCTRADYECWWHAPITWCSVLNPCHTGSWEYNQGDPEPPAPSPDYYPLPTCTVSTTDIPPGTAVVDSQPNAVNLQGCTAANMNWQNAGSFAFTYGDPAVPGSQQTDMDVHQLGTGLGGHMWFTHTGEPTDAHGVSLWGVTGTWAPDLTDSDEGVDQYNVLAYIPAAGATATQASYTIDDGSGNTQTVTINQNSYTDQWASLGTFWLAPGATVSLTNLHTTSAGDLGFSGMAFVPVSQLTAGPPSAPYWLHVLATSTSTFHLWWPDVASGVQYQIQSGGTSKTTAAGAISFDWGGASPGTRMCFQIRALSTAGSSRWIPAGSACATTPSKSAVPPSAPANLAATATTSHMTHLTWTGKAGGSAVYQISNGTATLITNAGASSFDWGAESAGTKTCFTIRAITATGASSWVPGGSPSPLCATTKALACQSSADPPDSGGMVSLYHGTSLANAQAIQRNGINPSVGRSFTDFGRGFYVTTSLTQASRWAKRFQNPTIVQYSIPYKKLTPGSLCGLVFPLAPPSSGFLAFVLGIRMVQQPLGCAGYDFTEGPLMANPAPFLEGATAVTFGQQDTFCTTAAASALDAAFVKIFPAS